MKILKDMRCPECLSNMTYVRLGTQQFVCRGCGFICERDEQQKLIKEMISNVIPGSSVIPKDVGLLRASKLPGSQDI